MVSDTVIRSRSIVTPDGIVDGVVIVRDGIIEAIEPAAGRSDRVFDVGDSWLLPGLIDTHVHVNDPGTDWEGWASASRAAAAGGITTLVDMPLNSDPVTVDHLSLDAKLAVAETSSIVDYACWLGVTNETIDDLTPELVHRAPGAKAFMCDSGLAAFGMADLETIERACVILAAAKRPLLVHAELAVDPPAWNDAVTQHASWAATRPPRFEHDAVRALARIAARTGAHIHVVHVSQPDSEHIAQDALSSASGIGKLTFETCPHYLLLAAEDVPDHGVAFKCAPPLQPRDRMEALRRWALDSGAMIVSDHSPASPALKAIHDGDFARAWGGIASIQLGLSLMMTLLHEMNVNDPGMRIARSMAFAPADLANLSTKGRIAPGADADLVAVDPEASWTVVGTNLEHRWPLTPYEGMQLRGQVLRTWLRGRPIFDARADADRFSNASTHYARCVPPFH